MPERNEIGAVVLAAGSSSRFGSDKLLYPVTLHGVTRPLAAHSLFPWLNNFARITVVVKPESELLRSAIERSLGIIKAAAIRWIVCQEAGQGMAASLACGVHATREAGGWLIGLADMPAVPSAAVAGVRDALLSGARLSAATCDGKCGHPVGFSSCYYEELLALHGDRGARQLLQRDASSVIPVPIGDNGIFADIDTPADVRKVIEV